MKELIKDNNDINSSHINYLPKQTYRIFGFVLVIILSIVFLLISIFLFIKGIYDMLNSNFEINNFLGSIIILIIGGIMSNYFPIYSSITVDMPKKIVTIRKYKFFFLKKKTTILDTDKIIQAYTEKNKDEGYGEKDNGYDGFDLIFILNDGHRIVALEGEIDKNNERKKLNFFLRQFFAFPTETDANNDTYIQMKNLNSQYQKINQKELLKDEL